jgi:hypothetical protein
MYSGVHKYSVNEEDINEVDEISFINDIDTNSKSLMSEGKHLTRDTPQGKIHKLFFL